MKWVCIKPRLLSLFSFGIVMMLASFKCVNVGVKSKCVWETRPKGDAVHVDL